MPVTVTLLLAELTGYLGTKTRSAARAGRGTLAGAGGLTCPIPGRYT